MVLKEIAVENHEVLKNSELSGAFTGPADEVALVDLAVSKGVSFKKHKESYVLGHFVH